jgi:hypothetical protein
VSTWGRWNPNVSEMTLEGPFQTGTTGTMKTREGRAHRMTLSSVQPGRAFSLQTSVIPLTRFQFNCEVVPDAGGSRISQNIGIEGPLGAVAGPMMGERIAKTFEPLLDNLAREAEGAASR